MREDSKSVVPDLEKIVRQNESPLGRVHALWTLEGLEAAKPGLLAEAIMDADPRVRQAAIRVSEPQLTEGDATIISA